MEKHTHAFKRSRPQASVEICACGKFRFTNNAGKSIEGIEENHTKTLWVKDGTRTIEEVAYYAGPNEQFVIRACNCHDELVAVCREALKHLEYNAHNPKLQNKIKDILKNAEAK